MLTETDTPWLTATSDRQRTNFVAGYFSAWLLAM